MASTRSTTPFSIAEFASLVESALDLEHEPDVSMHLPPSPTHPACSSPSCRLSSTSTVFSKFKQLVSPPRQRFERVDSRLRTIPTVSLVAPGPTDIVPYLPIASRHELSSLAHKTSSLFSEQSPTISSFPLTPPYSESISSSSAESSEHPSSVDDDPFAKGSVQIISVTPQKSKSRPRTRPPPLNIYAPPSCPLPSPPMTPSPGSSTFNRHPYASPVACVVRSESYPPQPNPLSPRRRGSHKRTGSPFPLSLTLHDDPKCLTDLPMPVECERNWMDMDSDDDESLDGMETPVLRLARRCHSDSEIGTPVQLAFPLSRQSFANVIVDNDGQTAYYSARSSPSSQFWYASLSWYTPTSHHSPDCLFYYYDNRKSCP